MPTPSNSTNPTSITDSGCQNIAYPTGMTPGAEVGNLIRVIQGASRGTPPRKIVANTATSITWDLPMVINPGDVWIIEEPTWPYSCDTTSLDNGNPLAVTTINMPTSNFVDETLVIAGFTVDVNGNESPDGDAPIREDWVFGAEGLSKVLQQTAAEQRRLLQVVVEKAAWQDGALRTTLFEPFEILRHSNQESYRKEKENGGSGRDMEIWLLR